MNDLYVYNCWHKWLAIQDIRYKYFMKHSQLKTSINSISIFVIIYIISFHDNLNDINIILLARCFRVDPNTVTK